ncbi:MAG: alkaline phosphatase family protein, partial [Acidobacteriota bacterium]
GTGLGMSGLIKTSGKSAPAKKMLILGFDGIDPHLLQMFMSQGKLPAFSRLASQGDFKPLGTSIPPQSPVAWSNFISGTNPGGHGIFDFIHRDPQSYIPTFSASETEEARRTISVGNLVLPLSGGEVKQLRRGKAFWKHLEDYDIPATVFKIPANYPPDKTSQRTISGMGTPDILGTYGIFNFYTTRTAQVNEDIGGGRIHEVYVIGNQIEAKIPGPVNTFKKNRPEASINFKVYLDPVHPVAKIVLPDQEFILKEGEWSSWKRICFNLLPTQSVSGICHFYLKQVRPDFKLYISPVNLDPANPALPICTPESYSRELEKRFGPFFTKGLPADTSALDNDVLDDGEFLQQDDFVLKERVDMFDYELLRFDSGLIFYYVSSTDQRQHMFWRHIDKKHPLYDPQLALKYGDVIEKIYQEADKILQKALNRADKNTLVMAMSDHGFTPFRYSFNLNTWLKEAGYLSLINPWRQGEEIFFMNTDWSKTRAYAIGLNGLYINQKGREAEGIVKENGKEALVREIAHKLERFVDSRTGEHPVLRAFVSQDVYHGPFIKNAPDIILGYNRGYRISWGSPLGRIPKEIIEPNTEKWSGDHCMAPEIIPGILLTNRKIRSDSPVLADLTATIMDFFGIEKPAGLTGRSIL